MPPKRVPSSALCTLAGPLAGLLAPVTFELSAAQRAIYAAGAAAGAALPPHAPSPHAPTARRMAIDLAGGRLAFVEFAGRRMAEPLAYAGENGGIMLAPPPPMPAALLAAVSEWLGAAMPIVPNIPADMPLAALLVARSQPVRTTTQHVIAEGLVAFCTVLHVLLSAAPADARAGAQREALDGLAAEAAYALAPLDVPLSTPFDLNVEVGRVEAFGAALAHVFWGGALYYLGLRPEDAQALGPVVAAGVAAPDDYGYARGALDALRVVYARDGVSAYAPGADDPPADAPAPRLPIGLRADDVHVLALAVRAQVARLPADLATFVGHVLHSLRQNAADIKS